MSKVEQPEWAFWAGSILSLASDVLELVAEYFEQFISDED